MDTLRWQTAWTGTGEYLVETSDKDVHYHEDSLDNAFGEKFRLIHDRPAARGQSRGFPFTIVTRGTQEPQKPFSSVSIKHLNWPRRNNKFSIRFNEKVAVERVWVEEYVDGLPWQHAVKDLSLDVNRSATFPFDRRFGRRYVICWAYKETK